MIVLWTSLLFEINMKKFFLVEGLFLLGLILGSFVFMYAYFKNEELINSFGIILFSLLIINLVFLFIMQKNVYLFVIGGLFAVYGLIMSIKIPVEFEPGYEVETYDVPLQTYKIGNKINNKVTKKTIKKRGKSKK